MSTAYDGFLRRTNLTLNSQPSTLNISYTYDSASRLDTITMGSQSATYSYVANSPLVGQILHKQSGSPVMTTAKSFDLINRLTSISSTAAGSTVASSAYQYNSANQRVRNTLADGSYWLYEFDALGQVKSGKKYWSDGTPVAGQQFEYGFDDIGNRISTKAGGDENGANLRPASYTPNSLNQYSSRSVTGAVQVTGISFATNSVLVNGQTAYRKSEYFWKELLTNNSAAPIWMTVTATATNQTPVSGNVFFPKTAEIFGNDPDGNTTNDGRFLYTWDAENRLVAVESLASSPQNSKRKVTWEFDGKGRRIRQTTYDGSSGTYVLTEDLKFVSDGWLHVAELNAANNALVRSYLWGLDLSGSLEGAGGVGGLLLVNSTANGAHFTCYDGNGNIVALLNAATSAGSAAYEYGPFAEPMRVTGPMAKENPFRFSTKRANDSADLLLYECRVQHENAGRWLARDPAEEDNGGPNLYGFVRNVPTLFVDPLGLKTIRIAIGQDRTLQTDYSFRRQNKEAAGRAIRTLNDTLQRCIEWCEHIPPQAIHVSVSGFLKAAPGAKPMKQTKR